MRTPGFSGADLANLMNEAAILAGRRGKDKITLTEIDDSIDRIGSYLWNGRDKDGLRTMTLGHDPVQKVTLVPRGQALGLTWFLPGEDPTPVSKHQLFDRIVGGLGGRAAEDVIFCVPEISSKSFRSQDRW